ncbi:hypothetical protein NZNM25_08050 [Nitrosopumilus zosterae]|uniref:Uncharacterized protein n=1 Tax=Nitrosopumilus zosterae TaxID=718286 RepID=A0A2S2KQX1_9ARCH|nr:hypothetical protein [Nitrosopumilus zosterae]BDQ30552.1 hypothetical protein NZOSNM25_000657 [Nitrosopumilus zosterae]GBH34014.1 hypothetical protein NZNM25_08050 [Nitrosopumilus zosterae]
MKPVKKFPKGRFSSSLWNHIEQIQKSDGIDTHYENEIMLNDLDLFVNQKSRRGQQNRCGAAV